MNKLIWSCFFGTSIEWYDFMIYNFLAPLVFDQLFFPKLNPVVGAIAVFGVFAVGFIARPLGGLFFGHYGDRIGRKPVMATTLIMMGLSTAAVGLLPTYASIGVWAPVLLLVLRFLQGFALGGESTGAPVIMLESSPDKKRGFMSSLAQTGVFTGTTLATLVAAAVVHLAKPDLMSWGWRVPFVASIVLVSIGLYIRTKVEESRVFQEAIKQSKPIKVPLFEVLAKYKKETLIVFLCAMTESGFFAMTAAFGLSYGAKRMHLPQTVLLNGVMVGHLVGIFIIPLCGSLSDRIGRRPVMATSFLTAGLFTAFAFFPMLQSHDTTLAWWAMAIPALLIIPGLMGVSSSFYPEVFRDARIRFSGVSLGRQLGTIAGGMVPMVCASLLAVNHGSLSGVILYFSAMAAASFIGVLCAKETKNQAI